MVLPDGLNTLVKTLGCSPNFGMLRVPLSSLPLSIYMLVLDICDRVCLKLVFVFLFVLLLVQVVVQDGVIGRMDVVIESITKWRQGHFSR